MSITKQNRVKQLGCILGALCLTPGLVAAQEADSDPLDGEGVFELGTMTVYGQPKTAAEKMESSINRDEINLLEKTDVGTALAKLPGVIYSRPGGGRHESGVYVRGFGSADVPIYIDGVPAYIPYDGTIDLARFKTGDVSVIKLAKGYSSVIYGPNTMGGAINIVSLRPTKALDGNVTVGVMSGNATETVANLGTLQDKWYAQIGASYYEQQYQQMADKFVGKDATGKYKNSDRKDYLTRDKKFSLKLGYTPNSTDEYVISYLKQEGKKGPTDGSGFVDTTWNWPTWDRETVSFVSNTKLDKFYIKPRLYYDTYKNSLVGFGGSKDASLYDDYVYGGSLEVGTDIIPRNMLKALLYYKFDHHGEYSTYGTGDTKVPGTEKTVEEKIYSFALEDTYSITDKWELQAGIAYNKRETTSVGMASNTISLINTYPQASSSLTPDIDSVDPEAVLFYKPTEQDAFHYSIAQKTKFPTIKQQFSNYSAGKYVTSSGKSCSTPGRNCFPLVSLQNPGLKPETALHQEIGYDGTPLDGLNVQAAIFYSTTKNKIGSSDYNYTAYPGYALRTTENIEGRTERAGLDLGLSYQVTPTLLFGLSYGYLSIKNKDDANYHYTDLPKHTGSWYMEYKASPWVTIVPSMDLFSSSHYNTAGDQKNPGAAIADLKLSITPPMYKKVAFNIGVNNLFNKDYRNYDDTYPGVGREVYANVRIDL